MTLINPSLDSIATIQNALNVLYESFKYSRGNELDGWVRVGGMIFHFPAARRVLFECN